MSNITKQVYGAWIKRYCVLCSRTYNTSRSLSQLPTGSRQAARGARICEIVLLLDVIRHQAITCNNIYLEYWHIMASLWDNGITSIWLMVLRNININLHLILGLNIKTIQVVAIHPCPKRNMNMLYLLPLIWCNVQDHQILSFYYSPFTMKRYTIIYSYMVDISFLSLKVNWIPSNQCMIVDLNVMAVSLTNNHWGMNKPYKPYI